LYNDFLIKTPIAQEIRARIDKLDCIKLKAFCEAEKTIFHSEKIAYRMGESPS
jgi:hypothetical protein